jgi:hypothetical protein
MTSRLRNPTKLARQAAYWRIHDRPDVAERIETALAANRHCKLCGRPITDELSLARGIGPECWAATHKSTQTDHVDQRAHRTDRQVDGWLVCWCGHREATAWGMAVHRKTMAGELEDDRDETPDRPA